MLKTSYLGGIADQDNIIVRALENVPMQPPPVRLVTARLAARGLPQPAPVLPRMGAA